MSKQKRSKIVNALLFIILVVIPWCWVIFYILVLAQPRYVSTSDVVIKQVSDTNIPAAGGLSTLLGANNTSKEDANYLTDFILSNDMIKRLDGQFNFRKAYHVNGLDPVYELSADATQEELLKYFKRRVHVTLNEQTSVLTITTEGFTPEYALALNKAILRESEQFVNRISQNIAQDQLVFSKTQLQEAESRLNKAKERLLDYQNDNQVFDPQANAQVVSQLVGNLQSQLATLRTEERQLLSYLNADAPQVISLRSQIHAVENQIEEEKEKLTSSDTVKLNRQTVQFETLKEDVKFATELYKLSLTSLEKARQEAFRKMKNLIVISTPYQAEEALYPRRVYVIGISLVLLLIFYGFVRLVMAVVKDHSG